MTVVASLIELNPPLVNGGLDSAIFLEKASELAVDKWRVLGTIGRALLHVEGHREVLDELGLNLISAASPEVTKIILNATYSSRKLVDDVQRVYSERAASRTFLT